MMVRQTYTYRKIYGQMDGHTYIYTYRYTDRYKDGQIGRHTDKEDIEDLQTHWLYIDRWQTDRLMDCYIDRKLGRPLAR